MTSAIGSGSPSNLGNISSVSTDPIKGTETPKPLTVESFKGKTVYQAITMKAEEEKAINKGDSFKIDKLVGHFKNEGGNIIADHYNEGSKKLFKFDVTWNAKVNGKDVEFSQVVYTSVEIPTDPSKLESAKKQAYEVAKSYELLQRNLTKTDDTTQMKAIRESTLISFEKTTPNLSLSNYKTSYMPKTASGVSLDADLLKLDRISPKTTSVFTSRLQKMQSKNIVLSEDSGIPQAEIERKVAGLSHSKVDDKDYKAHLDGKLKEVKKESKAALAPKKVANSDAIEIKQLHKEYNDLLDKKPGDLALLKAQQKIEEKFDTIPAFKDLQEAKKKVDDWSKKMQEAVKNSTGDQAESKLEIDSLKAQSNEIEAKIISMKSDILNNPIKEEEERFELKLEGEVDNGPGLDEISDDKDFIGDRDDPFKNWVDVGNDSEVTIPSDVELKELSNWKGVAKDVIKKYEDLFSANDQIVELKNEVDKRDEQIDSFHGNNKLSNEEKFEFIGIRDQLNEKYREEINEIEGKIPESFFEFLQDSADKASKDPEFVELMDKIDSYSSYHINRNG